MTFDVDESDVQFVFTGDAMLPFCAVNESKSVGTLCTVSYFRCGLQSKMFLSQTSLAGKPECDAALPLSATQYVAG